MGHSIDETRQDHIRLIILKGINYKKNNEQRAIDQIQRECSSKSKPTKRVETIKPLHEYVSKPPIILVLLGVTYEVKCRLPNNQICVL